MPRRPNRLAIILVAVLLALVAAPIGAQATAIHEDMYVPVGGIQQWITIRGEDRSNPVVLVLHGGPGDAWSPFSESLFAGWDKEFTLVQWDQRGAGRTFGKSGPSVEDTMTIDRMTKDGLEVAEYLTRHLGKKKVVLLGGSWGSILGVHMIHARPDLFHAYVSMAQMVNWRQNLLASYASVREMARHANDQASVSALTAIGPPPWDTLKKWPTYRKVLRSYQAKVVTAAAVPLKPGPGYDSPQEEAQYEAADEFSFVHFVGMTMSGPLTAVDLPALGLDVKVPVFVVQGEADLTALPGLAQAYFDSLKAPREQFVLVPGSGHEPTVASLAATRKLLLEQVRPLGSE